MYTHPHSEPPPTASTATPAIALPGNFHYPRDSHAPTHRSHSAPQYRCCGYSQGPQSARHPGVLTTLHLHSAIPHGSTSTPVSPGHVALLSTSPSPLIHASRLLSQRIRAAPDQLDSLRTRAYHNESIRGSTHPYTVLHICTVVQLPVVQLYYCIDIVLLLHSTGYCCCNRDRSKQSEIPQRVLRYTRLCTDQIRVFIGILRCYYRSIEFDRISIRHSGIQLLHKRYLHKIF